MYFALGICLTLACLLVVNLAVALAASAVWRLISAGLPEMSAATRAKVIFGLRVLPVLTAFVIAGGLVVPSYVLYEPDGSGEVVGSKLAIAAFVSFIAVLFALVRLARTFLSTRRLVTNWLANAERIRSHEQGVRVYKIEHQFPVIALVGIVRPRIFVAAKVLDTLTPGEIDAALAHEYGHLAASDNLKRALLRICRDLLIVPIGGGLDREWSQITEKAADERAARSGQTSALDLAGALVKIARIAPFHAHPAMPSGAFLIERDEIDVTSRVKSLLTISPGLAAVSDRNSYLTWLWAGVLAAILLLPLANQGIYSFTHEAIERIVRLLQ